MKVSFRRSKKVPRGFVISLEFLLVVALVVIPLMIGMILLAGKAVTLYRNYMAAIQQHQSRPVVWDSSVPAKPLGPVVGYDEFDAPQILYRDASTGLVAGGAAVSPGVLLGVRPHRFTSVSRVYYAGAGCTGTPYIRTAASGSPEVDKLAQTQGLNYAVGDGNVLYRESAGPPVAPPFGSAWTSRNNLDASPESSPSTACSNTSVPAFLGTQNGGVVNRVILDTYANFVVVLTGSPATQAGLITTIHYYVRFATAATPPAVTSGSIVFLLVNGANQVQWASPGIPVVAVPPGGELRTFNPAPPVAVQAGWKLGYYTAGRGIIPQDFTGPGFPQNPTPAYAGISYAPNGSGLPVLGQTVVFEGSHPTKVYSFGVYPASYDVWVAADPVAALGSPFGALTGNFTPPFRTAFPYSATGPPLPPSTGG